LDVRERTGLPLARRRLPWNPAAKRCADGTKLRNEPAYPYS
jgi:hypothetical protein